MNDEIVAAAAKHPEVTVIDWNVYSRSHPEWFQADGLHLLAGGSQAMAGLIHEKLVTAGIAAAAGAREDDRSARGAARHAVLARRLAAAGGRAPYTWSLTGPPACRACTCAPTGLLSGAPRRDQARRLHVRRAREGRDRPDRHAEARCCGSR